MQNTEHGHESPKRVEKTFLLNDFLICRAFAVKHQRFQFYVVERDIYHKLIILTAKIYLLFEYPKIFRRISINYFKEIPNIWELCCLSAVLLPDIQENHIIYPELFIDMLAELKITWFVDLHYAQKVVHYIDF